MPSHFRPILAISVFSVAVAVLPGFEPPAEAEEAVPPVSVDPAAKPLRNLSEYHLFKGTGYDQIPNDGVVPFDVTSPLFSDYATKHRFIWMPLGTSAEYRADDVFSFPVGTVIIKSFGFLDDMRDPSKGERIIETRLMIHQVDGWVGLPYVWKDDESDAVLKVAGTTVDVQWIHTDGQVRKNNYIVPNLNQCKSCHENNKVMLPIGPKARNLNRDYPYAHGTENQLAYWAQVGYLKGAPASPEAAILPVWNDPATGTVTQRARAWLEINCMHCHNPAGGANTTALDLSYAQTDARKVGFMKPPVAAGRGSGGRLYDIVPGKPDESILVYRLESVDPGVMMPELPRRLVDDEGTALIRDWIASMDPAAPIDELAKAE